MDGERSIPRYAQSGRMGKILVGDADCQPLGSHELARYKADHYRYFVGTIIDSTDAIVKHWHKYVSGCADVWLRSYSLVNQ